MVIWVKLDTKKAKLKLYEISASMCYTTDPVYRGLTKWLVQGVDVHKLAQVKIKHIENKAKAISAKLLEFYLKKKQEEAVLKKKNWRNKMKRNGKYKKY